MTISTELQHFELCARVECSPAGRLVLDHHHGVGLVADGGDVHHQAGQFGGALGDGEVVDLVVTGDPVDVVVRIRQ